MICLMPLVHSIEAGRLSLPSRRRSRTCSVPCTTSASSFASPGSVSPDQAKSYALPGSLQLNQWALGGDWSDSAQFASLQRAPGTIAFHFHARDLHLVLGPASDGRSAFA
jgi:hypothetical protein